MKKIGREKSSDIPMDAATYLVLPHVLYVLNFSHGYFLLADRDVPIGRSPVERGDV